MSTIATTIRPRTLSSPSNVENPEASRRSRAGKESSRKKATCAASRVPAARDSDAAPRFRSDPVRCRRLGSFTLRRSGADYSTSPSVAGQ